MRSTPRNVTQSLDPRCVIILPLNDYASTQQDNRDRPEAPIFVRQPPTEVVFTNTDGAALSCTAYGRPAPSLGWITESGRPLEEKQDILHILPNNTLYFPPFDSSTFDRSVHGSSYRCTAENTAGKVVSRLVKVKAVLIDQLRTYYIHLSDVFVMRGNTAVLRCEIYPVFVRDYVHVVGWTQGARRIPPGYRVSILPRGVLHMRDVLETDSYTTFSCITRNTLTGEEKSSSFAYLHVHDPPVGGAFPIIMDFLENANVNSGQDVELPCVANGDPAPSYTWTKNSIPVSVDDELSRFSIRGGNLVIENSMASDSGDYTCSAKNERGERIAVTTFSVRVPLSVNIEPDTLVVDSGKTAVLNCTIYGHPVDKITWYHNGIRLASYNTDVQSHAVLHLRNMRRLDMGVYQCEVSNSFESALSSAELQLGAAGPTITNITLTQLVHPGTYLVLKCIATGIPTPIIRWTQDGSRIPLNVRYMSELSINQNSDAISYLNISGVVVSDGGEFSCHAENHVGIQEKIVTVDVYGQPYIRPFRNVTATAGRSLIMKCFVTGYPVTSVKWLRGGEVLPVNHRQQVTGHTLTIMNVQKPEDAGRYVCEAMDDKELKVRENVYIRILEPPIIDPFILGKKRRGGRVRVSCVVSSGDLPLTFSWRKDGKSLTTGSDGIRIQKTGAFSSTLSILRTNLHHNGIYSCHANNAAANASYSSELIIQVAPHWILEPVDNFVVFGGTTMVDCQTDGKPKPEVIWKKAQGSQPGNYAILSSMETIASGAKRIQVLTNGSLLIQKAKIGDHGYYLCHASNGIGAGLSKVVFIIVHVPAQFKGNEKNYTAVRGSNTSLDCLAIGDRPMTITWTLNDQSLYPAKNSRLSVVGKNSLNGRISQVLIQNVARSDMGLYACAAKNQFGRSSLLIHLLVIEPPDPPLNIIIDNHTSRSITLSWRLPYNGNRDIQAFMIMYRRHTDASAQLWHNITVPGTQMAATLRDLYPAQLYSTCVVAKNTVGFSARSKRVTVTLDEAAPEGAPVNVQVLAIGSESLNITWRPPGVDVQNGKIIGYYVGIREHNSSLPYTFSKRAVLRNTLLQSYVIENLKKFTRYSVLVKAYNSKGSGPTSVDVYAYTMEDVPSHPPQDIRTQAISSDRLHVSWAAPPLTSLNGILQGYKVLYGPVRDDEDESGSQILLCKGVELTLEKLLKYTNYTLQVWAYTRMGEGVRSEPLFIQTSEDIPEAPAEVKALVSNQHAIMVSWRPPNHSNGVVTEYSIYYRRTMPRSREDRVDVTTGLTHYLLSSLDIHAEYTFSVSASTRIGEGGRTHLVSAITNNKVPAKVVSFAQELAVVWQGAIVLPCLSVGDPPILTKWWKRGEEILYNKRVRRLDNGSLLISDAETSDRENFTCHVENWLGSDHITVTLTVHAPPKPPLVSIATVTTKSVQINWLSQSNGGSVIQGYHVWHRHNHVYPGEHMQWIQSTVGSKVRSFSANQLRCGTSYKFYVQSFNKIGTSKDSQVLILKTNGSAPIAPPQSMLLSNVNMTFIKLDLKTWRPKGCPVTHYSVRYQVWDDVRWILVSNNISNSLDLYKVEHLQAATWYVMVVTAYSDAGSSDCELKFSTLSSNGGEVRPLYVAHRYPKPFYKNMTLMIPLAVVSLLLFLVAVIVYLYCRQKESQQQDKETNLRRDLTVETSLMNDLDRRFTQDDLDVDSADDLPDNFNSRKMNLTLLNSGDSFHGNNIPEESQPWLFPDWSKSNSENLSKSGISDDLEEGTVYNTSCDYTLQAAGRGLQVSVGAQSNNQAANNVIKENSDDIAKIKSHNKLSNDSYNPWHLRQEDLPFNNQLPTVKEGMLFPSPPPTNRSGNFAYENQGIILSPQKCSGTDTFPPRPQRPKGCLSTAGKDQTSKPSRPNRPPPNRSSASSSDEKGSQKNSHPSSVTTISSSRDELLQVLENARKNPIPAGYEKLQRSAGDPNLTDSSVSTEPGIVKFTNVPPTQNEIRQGICDVPSSDSEGSRFYHKLQRSPFPRQFPNPVSTPSTDSEYKDYNVRWGRINPVPSLSKEPTYGCADSDYYPDYAGPSDNYEGVTDSETEYTGKIGKNGYFVVHPEPCDGPAESEPLMSNKSPCHKSHIWVTPKSNNLLHGSNSDFSKHKESECLSNKKQLEEKLSSTNNDATAAQMTQTVCTA